uniref:NADH dehydrogenase [ubiquinone] 1 alpha subcomplex subunit 9, mitochondrial n=1 Tax=Strigamia maritima TaxID=126957 RepID=T1JE21_STRMM
MATIAIGRCLPVFTRSQILSCVRVTGTIVPNRNYNGVGELETEIDDPVFSKLKRGKGGRSSFNGIVATVFGATGFLARHLINKLGKQGTQIIVPYRGDSYDVLRLKLTGDLGQVLFVPFNLKDENSIAKAMKYSNVVVNLIGRDFETKNYTYNNVHVDGARSIARMASQTGVKKLIHVSSMNVAESAPGVILNGGSKFLSSKYLGELAVREEFPDATIIRPAEIFGQGDRYLRYYASVYRKEGSFIPMWNKGEGIFKQPVFVSDVAKGIVNAIFDKTAVGRTYQGIGPRLYELRDLIEWYYKLMRKDKENYYYIVNMKYIPSFRLRVSFVNKFAPSMPTLIWDKMEREHTTDEIDPFLPTLVDLGVNPTLLEDQAPWELRPYRAYNYYQPELGEFPDPEPPKYVDPYAL